MPTIELVRIICEVLLCGLIWVIQLSIYPKISKLKREDQALWHLYYTLLITAIISPLIIIHFLVLVYEYSSNSTYLGMIQLALSTLVISVTLFYQAPQHLKMLVFGPDILTLHKITRCNWIRTISWSLCLILSLFW